ncbi:ParB family protein [Burkholderia multivorans]
MNHAVMAEVVRLEAKYNDAQPFPSVDADRGNAGRPL